MSEFHKYVRSIPAACATVLLLLPVSVHPQVTVADTTDEGQECFRITTPTAVYYYQKEGCGFSSILDRDGNDWVSYDDDFPNSAQGGYRGIPNLGWQFHP